MKKVTSFILGVLIIFGFIISANAKDKYELREVELSEKNIIYSIVKLNDKKDGFLAIGELYHMEKPENYTGSVPLNPEDSFGNVYNVSFEGVITKANLFYENNSYDYIDIDVDNNLTHNVAGAIGFYNPIYVKSAITNDEGPVDDIDESLVFKNIYCPLSIMDNDDSSNPHYDFLGNTSTQNFVCAVIATNASSELLYGIIMQGPGAKVVFEPTTGFVPSHIFEDKVMLKREDNTGYVVASSDGIVDTLDNLLLEKIQDTYDDEIYIEPMNIEVVSFNNKLIYQIPVNIVNENRNEKVYVYNNNIIGTYSAQSIAVKMKTGFVFIEDVIADKLYNLDGTVLADAVNPYGYCYTGDCNIITYVKDEKINFFDGKSVIYQMNYDDKYEYLLSYQISYNSSHAFLSGDITPEGYRSKLVILTKIGEEVEKPAVEVKEETSKQEVKYEVLDGNNQTYDTKGKDLLKFRFSVPFADFIASGKVYLDGKLVDSKNYESSEGSTIITFKQDFSKELKDGDHTVKIVTDLGEVTANFKSIGNPKTLDNSLKMIGLLSLSIAGVYYTCVRIKKES